MAGRQVRRWAGRPPGDGEQRSRRSPVGTPGGFDDFTDERIDVGEVEPRVRHAGHGPAVLLVHGHPRTGATWHQVGPRLVHRGFTVVCPDMRGYGQSGKADLRPDHSQQSKRAVAADLARLMATLGHERFAVVGHDRGAYVALRLALDHPDAVDHLVVIGRADQRGPRQVRRHVRPRLVPLVLLRPAGHSGAGHQRLPRRLVRRHRGGVRASPLRRRIRVTPADLLRCADGTRDDDPWPLVRQLVASGDPELPRTNP
ncbi:alpha/beta fold hydrolase [Micromonospora sp. NPDC049282]|uniref:alpha/beta fold hydrolase n=1 Tax=Micromonospora sp. NPDC049282 TaxID=3364269 RepID=UPI0037104813